MYRKTAGRGLGPAGREADYSAFCLVKVDRATGAVTTEALDLPGFPISLSVTGRKALLVRTVVRQPSRESAWWGGR